MAQSGRPRYERSKTVRKPDFLIIGAPRAGTSWVWSQLAAHPGTDLPELKEPFFFGSAEIYRKGFEWYYEIFRNTDPNKLTGEGSTSNFYDKVPFFYNKGHALVHDETLPTIPELICDALGDVKIIICLRDPVERSMSYFKMWQGQGVVSPFARLRDVAERYPKLRIVEQSFYARYLSLWRQFVPEERLCILMFEDDIRAKPKNTLKRLFSFLDLDSEISLGDSEKPVNKHVGRVGGAVRYYFGETVWRAIGKLRMRRALGYVDALEFWPDPITPEDVEYLRSHFLPERHTLEAMLGRDLASWRYGESRLAAESGRPSNQT